MPRAPRRLPRSRRSAPLAALALVHVVAHEGVLAARVHARVGDVAAEGREVGVGNDAQWRRFCPVAGLQDVADAPRFATNAARVAHFTETVEMVRQPFRIGIARHAIFARMDAVGVLLVQLRMCCIESMIDHAEFGLKSGRETPRCSIYSPYSYCFRVAPALPRPLRTPFAPKTR